MPTSALGSKANDMPWQRMLRRYHSGLASRGFTLLELMVVVAIVAITAAVASLALPNPASSRLEREAARLVALLESARAEARAGGITVIWIPKGSQPKESYQFLGMPAAAMPALTWLEPEVRAQVVDGSSLVLGPEPVIGAQQVVLSLDDQQMVIGTDGLSAFAVVRGSESDAGTNAEQALP